MTKYAITVEIETESESDARQYLLRQISDGPFAVTSRLTLVPVVGRDLLAIPEDAPLPAAWRSLLFTSDIGRAVEAYRLPSENHPVPISDQRHRAGLRAVLAAAIRA